MWLHPDEKADFVGLSQSVVCQILRHHRQSGHVIKTSRTTSIDYQTRSMSTDKLIFAVESGKYERAIFVVCEEYTMESTFLAKLFIRVWFNVNTELEEYPYLHALLFLIEFLDFAGLGCVKGFCSHTGYMLSSGQEGAAPLIVKMEDRLSID